MTSTFKPADRETWLDDGSLLLEFDSNPSGGGLQQPKSGLTHETTGRLDESPPSTVESGE